MAFAYPIAIGLLVSLCVAISIFFYKTRSRGLFLSISGVNVSILLTALSAKNATTLYDQIIVATCLITAAAFHIASLRSTAS
jgi:hypothetical protein